MTYEVDWDAGSGGQSYEILNIATMPFTYYIYIVTDVLPSKPYRFIYRATNQ